MIQIGLFYIGKNCANGIICDILHIDVGRWEGALLGIDAAKGFLYINFLYKRFMIYDNTDYKNL